MTELRVLDLCSGLGGASQAFVDAGDTVLRVDNSERCADVPHTQIADVRFFDPPGEWDVVLAGPPCEQLSDAPEAYNGSWKANGSAPVDLSVHRACFAIAELYPRATFILENVRGAQRWLGPPVCHRGSRYLWGRFHGPLPVIVTHPKYLSWGNDPDGYWVRSRWPYSLSLAARAEALREQPSR